MTEKWVIQGRLHYWLHLLACVLWYNNIGFNLCASWGCVITQTSGKEFKENLRCGFVVNCYRHVGVGRVQPSFLE